MRIGHSLSHCRSAGRHRRGRGSPVRAAGPLNRTAPFTGESPAGERRAASADSPAGGCEQLESTAVPLISVGCDYRSNSLETIEQLTVNSHDLPKALHNLMSTGNLSEAVLLSHVQPRGGVRVRRAVPRRLCRCTRGAGRPIRATACDGCRRALRTPRCRSRATPVQRGNGS